MLRVPDTSHCQLLRSHVGSLHQLLRSHTESHHQPSPFVRRAWPVLGWDMRLQMGTTGMVRRRMLDATPWAMTSHELGAHAACASERARWWWSGLGSCEAWIGCGHLLVEAHHIVQPGLRPHGCHLGRSAVKDREDREQRRPQAVTAGWRSCRRIWTATATSRNTSWCSEASLLTWISGAVLVLCVLASRSTAHHRDQKKKAGSPEVTAANEAILHRIWAQLLSAKPRSMSLVNVREGTEFLYLICRSTRWATRWIRWRSWARWLFLALLHSRSTIDPVHGLRSLVRLTCCVAWTRWPPWLGNGTPQMD